MSVSNFRFTSAGRAALQSALGLGMFALIGLAPAQADNALQDITFSTAPSGAVDIVLELSAPAVDANVFTTDDPPRIAVDLPATRNAVDRRRIPVGSGATSAITALEAGGRTRVVVDLFRSASFESRAEGNRLILSIGPGEGAAMVAAGDVPVDPARRSAATAAVSSVDFRRGDDGAGRVIVRFDSDSVGADLREEDQAVLIDFDRVTVPDALVERLDVTDFATPVQSIELRPGRNGAQLAIAGIGEYETMAYQTGNEYVVEISPVAAVVDPQAPGVGALEATREYTGTPVTFNFQNIPVRTVLRLIAEESGLNIVAADTVTGNVTLRLVNVPWDQALDIVLRAKGLDKRREQNVVWVAPQSEIAGYEEALASARLALQDRAELITEYIPINYGSAEEIAALLTEEAKQATSGAGAGAAGQQSGTRGFLSARGSVTFDRRTNTLLLNDTLEKVLEIKALVALLDRPVDQVLIEARIVVASESFARELGARFGISGGYEDDNGTVVTSSGSQSSADRMANIALDNRFAGRSSGLPVAAPGGTGGGILTPSLPDRLNVNLPVISPAGSIGFAILGADYLLDLELSALESEGRGEVVSSPRVITANQREAIIRQGDEVGYVTISPATAGAIPTPNVQFKDVLLVLAVTPTITQDGRVFLAVNVQKDDLAGFVDTSIGSVPQITTREVTTAVLIDDGQTVVIGGVYEFSKREDLTKVPFLGDVPFLGNLFRNKGRSTTKAELLIFITPKVIAVKGA